MSSLSLSWLPRRLVVSLAVVTFVAVVAAVAFGLAYPDPVSSGALGPDWQCTRLAIVFTSCTRVVRVKTAAAAAEEGRAPSCPRSAAWRYAPWRNAPWRTGLGLLR